MSSSSTGGKGDDHDVESEKSPRLGTPDSEAERAHEKLVFSEDNTDSLGPTNPGYARRKGEPYKYNSEFKGPIKNRSCTDVICCIIFILFIIGMAVISVIGYARGKPLRLVYPTDSEGGICGVGKFKDMPYLFFFDLALCARMGPAVIGGCPTPQICVKKCPTSNYVYLESQANSNRSSMICHYGVNPDKSPYKEMTVKELVDKNICASYFLSSKPVINRCVPTILSEVVGSSQVLLDDSGKYKLQDSDGYTVDKEAVLNGTKSLLEFFKLHGIMEMVFQDTVSSLHLIIICLVLTAVLSMIWIVLLRWITTIMVWGTFLIFVGVSGFGAAYSFYKYNDMKNMNVTAEYKLPQVFKFDFDYFLSLKDTWLAFGIITSVFGAIILLIIIFLCSRIVLATKLISEASVAISHMWSVLFWPLAPFVMHLLVFIYCASSAVFIASMGPPEFYTGNVTQGNEVKKVLNQVPCDHVNGTLNDLCYFVKYGGDQYKAYMLAYTLFMFFWLTGFVTALGEMTLAGAFASYYWAWDKDKDMPSFPLLASFWRALRYHTGSLAFGSLIIAIVQMIRAILEYVNAKIRTSDNECAKFLLKCLRCCFWCLEKFLRFINKITYIVIAVHGENFCTAAKDGFFLMMRNVLRAAVLDKVCDFVMFISKLVVAGGIGVLAVFWFRGSHPLFENIVPDFHYYLVPVILTVIGAYIIASSFFSVYNMGVDTLFICFLEDIERNDGSPEKPYLMSKSRNLRRILLNKKG